MSNETTVKFNRFEGTLYKNNAYLYFQRGNHFSHQNVEEKLGAASDAYCIGGAVEFQRKAWDSSHIRR